MIKNFNKFNDKSYEDYFSYLYELAPKELKDLIDSTKEVMQNEVWHPEYDVYEHIRLVVNRLHKTYNDINLDLAGLYHDLGKASTTEWSDEKKSWIAPGHEYVSCEMLDDQSNFVKKMGGDYKLIYYIVENHMKIKYLDNFRIQNKIEILNNKYFNELMKFDSADFGGDELNCKPIRDLSDIKKEIQDYKLIEIENKEISKKFNGNIIMEIYPELKGKELGNAITKFKEYIFNKFNISIRKYILTNKSSDILNEFDLFIKK
jgi:hypothetical protein